MGLRIDKNVGPDGSFGRTFDIIKAAAISYIAPFSASGALRSRWRSCRHLCAADDPVKVIEQLICAHFAAPLAAHDIMRLRYARALLLCESHQRHYLPPFMRLFPLCNNTAQHIAKNAAPTPTNTRCALRDTSRERVALRHFAAAGWFGRCRRQMERFAPRNWQTLGSRSLSLLISAVCFWCIRPMGFAARWEPFNEQPGWLLMMCCFVVCETFLMEGKCVIRLGLNFHRAIFRHDIASRIMILKIAPLWGRHSHKTHRGLL